MPADDLPAEPGIMLGELDDEGLLAALHEVIGHGEPVPEWSADLAKSSYGLRDAAAERTMDGVVASPESDARTASSASASRRP